MLAQCIARRSDRFALLRSCGNAIEKYLSPACGVVVGLRVWVGLKVSVKSNFKARSKMLTID